MGTTLLLLLCTWIRLLEGPTLSRGVWLSTFMKKWLYHLVGDIENLYNYITYVFIQYITSTYMYILRKSVGFNTCRELLILQVWTSKLAFLMRSNIKLLVLS